MSLPHTHWKALIPDVLHLLCQHVHLTDVFSITLIVYQITRLKKGSFRQLNPMCVPKWRYTLLDILWLSMKLQWGWINQNIPSSLQAQKTLLVPTPRLRTGLFNKITPPAGANKEQLRVCASSQVSACWSCVFLRACATMFQCRFCDLTALFFPFSPLLVCKPVREWSNSACRLAWMPKSRWIWLWLAQWPYQRKVTISLY